MARASKGSKFERDLCRQLSMWWSHNKRDDIFWRSSASGARAKVRGRAGKSTYGQHGDICATDPIGDPLIRALSIEAKRGYNRSTVADLLDCPSSSAPQVLEQFLAQTIESAKHSKSFSWLLITKRDKRDPLVIMPWKLVTALMGHGCFGDKPRPFATFSTILRWRQDTLKRISLCRISAMRLDDWLESVSPSVIRRLTK